jgi:GT2 family glycosyltransferase
MTMTAITVVVATRDRRDQLMRTLARLQALPERPAVIVVDDASRDGTLAQVARDAPWARVVALPTSRGAGARNAGAAAADTPYVAFADDDSWYAPGALTRAAAALDADSGLAGVAARILVGPDEREDPVCAAMRRSPLPPRPDGAPTVLGFLACGVVLRRDAFLAVGGFDGRLGVGGEEELLAMDLAAAGWRLAYRDDVVAHHHPPPRRDTAARRRVQTRNALWCAWLRRPASRALAVTAAAVGRGLTDPAARRGLLDALRGLRPVLADRRVVPPYVERGLRALAAGR